MEEKILKGQESDEWAAILNGEIQEGIDNQRMPKSVDT